MPIPYNLLLERISCPSVDDEVTDAQLEGLKRYINILFKKLNIQTRFPYHFAERINDERNGRQISICELRAIFDDVYKKHGARLANVKKHDWQAIIKSISTDINIPFVVDYLGPDKPLSLRPLTIMRKRNFVSNRGEQMLTVESINEALEMYSDFINSDNILFEAPLQNVKLKCQQLSSAFQPSVAYVLQVVNDSLAHFGYSLEIDPSEYEEVDEVGSDLFFIFSKDGIVSNAMIELSWDKLSAGATAEYRDVGAAKLRYDVNVKLIRVTEEDIALALDSYAGEAVDADDED